MTRVLDDQHTVILLANTGPGFFDETLHEITGQIFSILAGGSYTRPRQPTEQRLYELMAREGAEGLEAKVERLESSGDVETSQQGFYSLGRALIEEGRLGDAVRVFELVVARYPESSWSYMGLAEAHEAKGDRQAALENLERAVEIVPDSRRAAESLQRLKNRQ